MTTFRLTDKRGTNEFILNSLSTGAHTFSGGLQMFSRDRRTMWHTGIDGVSHLLRLMEGDFGAAFQVALGGEWTEASHRLAKLERWLTQANLATLNPARTFPVFLGVKLDDMAIESFHKIKYAVLDTQTALINPVTMRTANGVPIYGATIVLTLEAGGPKNAIPVGNILKNAATEHWRTDGTLPLYWSKMGTPTFRKVEDRVLFGFSAVEITATTVGDGISSTYTDVPVNHLAVASAWISMDNTSSVWAFRIYVAGVGAVAEQTNITYAWLQTNADDTHVDPNGNTWYLISCVQDVSDLTLTTSMRVDFYETTNTGTNVVYFNGAMLTTVKVVTIPPSPDNPKSVDGSGYEFTCVDPTTTTIDTDDTNKFEGTASYSVTFNTTSGTDGCFRTRLFLDDEQGEEFVAQFWARMVTGGGASAMVRLMDGAGNVLDYREFDNDGGASDLSAVADAEYQGVDEQTWYAIRLTGTNSLSPGIRIAFTPTSTGTGDDFQFFLNSTYIYKKTDLASHTTFVSGDKIWNRNDATTANPDRIGSIIVYNLPEDMDADLDWEIEPYNYTASTTKIVRMWAYSSSRNPGVAFAIEAEDMTANGILWADVSDTSAHAGNVARMTATGSPSSGYIYYRIPPDQLDNFSSAPLQIYVRAKTSNATGASVWMEVSTNGGQTLDTHAPVSFNSTSYELLYLGTLNLRYDEEGTSALRGIPEVDIRIYAEHTTPGTVTIDCVMPRPAISDRHAAWRFPEFSVYDRFVIRGCDRVVVRRQAFMPTIGEPPWRLEPGNTSHRIFLTQTSAANEAHTLADYVKVRLMVHPRTANLLGSI